MPRPLYSQGKSPQYPWDRRLGVPHMMKRKILSPHWETNPRTLIVQPVV